jgi:hypothetical protein
MNPAARVHHVGQRKRHLLVVAVVSNCPGEHDLWRITWHCVDQPQYVVLSDALEILETHILANEDTRTARTVVEEDEV